MEQTRNQSFWLLDSLQPTVFSILFSAFLAERLSISPRDLYCKVLVAAQ
jgi:hypothetical protein